MVVHEVMSTIRVTAQKSETIRSAVLKMMGHHWGSLPVVEGKTQLVGVIALRDVLLPVYPNAGDYRHDDLYSRDFVEMEKRYEEVLGGTVEEFMTPSPFTVSPDDPILEAASFMGRRNFRHIPVVGDGKLVGMLSLGDINRGLFSQMLFREKTAKVNAAFG